MKDLKGTQFCQLMVQEESGTRVLTGASSPLSTGYRESKSQRSPYAPHQCLAAEELTADTIHCVLAISLVSCLNCPGRFLAFCSSALHVLMVVYHAELHPGCWHSTAAKKMPE